MESSQALAVLPLENSSGNPGENYFADEMTGELISNLGGIRALRVISRESVMQYKGTQKPVSEIARELKVDVVVKGSVQHFGESVRITASLIRATTGQELWKKDFEHKLRDILSLQSQLVLAIVQEVRIKLTPQEQTRLARTPAVNSEAYQLYLQGRSYLETRVPEDIKKGIDCFRKAVAKDPGFALAYVGLANSYLHGEGTFPPTESYLIVKAAATTALELDDSLAEAHASLASVKMLFDWNWLAAESAFKTAIDLNRSNATAHHWYAEYLTAIGRHEEAIAEIKQTLGLDPLSVVVHGDVGWHYYCAGRYDQAIAQLRDTLKMRPDSYRVHWLLGLAYVKKAMFAEAIAEMQMAVSLSSRSNNRTWLGYAYASAGRRDEAQQILETLNEPSNGSTASPFFIAAIYGELGDKEQAFAWLERAYDEHSGLLVYLNVDPILDSLRADERFRKLTQRVGLPK